MLSNSDCKEILTKYLNEPREIISSNVSKISEVPIGFLGDHFRLEIEYENNLDGLPEKASFFMKTIPKQNKKHSEYVSKIGVFKKEALLYKNILNDLQRYYKIPFAPLSYLVKPDELIVLEDLSLKNYELINVDLTKEQWESILVSMAKFHASSIIYEEERSTPKYPYRIIDNFKIELQEATFSNVDGHPRNTWAKNTSKALVDLIQLLPNISQEKLETISRKLAKFTTKDIYSYLQASNKYRNVITHSDLWRNNMMFRKKHNKYDSIFVDFQLARYVPPAFDLLATFYLNCSKKFLMENMSDMLQFYYDQFCDCLEQNGINSSQIYCKEDFYQSVENYKLPALVEAAMFGTIVFLSDKLSTRMVNDEHLFEEFTFYNRSKYVCQEFLRNEHFRTKNSDILKQLLVFLDTYDV